MHFTLFSKTDKTIKKRFFNPTDSTDDSLAGTTGQERSGSDSYRGFDTRGMLTKQKLLFLRPRESLEDILEKLLRHAEYSNGNSRNHYLEAMLNLLKRNPELVNRVPNKFHSNPLELVIRLGEFKIAAELLMLKAIVRPENRTLLAKIEHLLFPNKEKKQHYYIGISS